MAVKPVKVVRYLCALAALMLTPTLVSHKKIYPCLKPAHKKVYPKNVLESSVRVNHKLTGASCGVIIGAQNDGGIYEITILSTGHMRDRTRPEIEIFYLDGKRLKEPLYVKGNISLLVENGFDKGIDFCIIKATLGHGKVTFTPLAPLTYVPKKNEKLLSAGCDDGIEPKLYTDLTFDHYKKDRGDFHTCGGSRVGRSGGGIFTLDGKTVIGVCWGGYADKPVSMFTSHRTIIELMDQCGIK